MSHLQVLMGSMSHSSMGLSTTTVCTLSLHCTGPWYSGIVVSSWVQYYPDKANVPPPQCCSFLVRTALLGSWCRRCRGCTSSPAASPRCTPPLATGRCEHKALDGGDSTHLVTLEAGGVALLHLLALLLLDGPALGHVVLHLVDRLLGEAFRLVHLDTHILRFENLSESQTVWQNSSPSSTSTLQSFIQGVVHT